MKLFARKFARNLRRRVRKEVKGRPDWSQESSKWWWKSFNRTFDISALRWLLYFVLFGLVAADPHGLAVWQILAFWSTGLIFQRVGQVQKESQSRNQVYAFVQLPVDDRTVFHYLMGRSLRSSLWLLGDALTAGIAAGCLIGFSPAGWLALIPAVVLIWAATLAAATILYWRWPRLPGLVIGAFFIFGGFMGRILFADKGIVTHEQMDALINAMFWISPPGWACQIAAWAVGARPEFPAVPATLLALCLAFAVPCFQALADGFTFWEKAAPPMSQKSSGIEGIEEEPEEAEYIPVPTSPEDTFRFAPPGFLRAPTAPREGWLDRLILQRVRGNFALVDFLLGTVPAWSRNYVQGALVVLCAPLLSSPASVVSNSASHWILAGILIIALGWMTPIFGGQWQGFGVGVMGPHNVAVLSFLPVGFREVRSVVLSINAWRFLAAFPWWPVAGFWMAWTTGSPGSTGLLQGVEVWFALLLFQPFFLVFKFSQGTNDSQGCLSTMIFLAAGSVPCAAIIWFFVSILNDASWPWHVGLLLAIGVGSFAFEAFYRRLYNGRLFDLVAKRPPETT